MRAGYLVVASSGNVLGWAFFLREVRFCLREACILQLFLSLNTTKIITYEHVHAFKLTPVPGRKLKIAPRETRPPHVWRGAPACEASSRRRLVHANPEPRLPDEVADLGDAQFFFFGRGF